MDYENFKEQFVADVKERFAEQGSNMNVTINEVNKLNESYEAITVTPEDGNIGMNININKFFDAMEDGMSYDKVVDKAMDAFNKGIEQKPEFDVSAITDYSQMKEKLVMEVVSAEANKDMLETVPHKDMAKEAGAVYHVKRCVLVNTEKLDQYLEHFCDTE